MEHIKIEELEINGNKEKYKVLGEVAYPVQTDCSLVYTLDTFRDERAKIRIYYGNTGLHSDCPLYSEGEIWVRKPATGFLVGLKEGHVKGFPYSILVLSRDFIDRKRFQRLYPEHILRITAGREELYRRKEAFLPTYRVEMCGNEAFVYYKTSKMDNFVFLERFKGVNVKERAVKFAGSLVGTPIEKVCQVGDFFEVGGKWSK